DLINEGFISANPNFLVNAPILIISLFMTRGLATFIASYFMAKVGRSAVRDYRIILLEKMMLLPSHYFENIPSGNIISKVNYDTEQVAQALSGAISDAIRGLFIAIAMLSVMFSKSVQITLSILIVVPILAIFLNYVSRHLRRYSLKVQKTMGDVTKVTGEIVEGFQVIRVFSGQEYEKRRVRSAMFANFTQEMKMHLVSAGSAPVMQFIGSCALAALVYMATSSKLNMNVGDFTGMFGATLSLLRPIKQIASVNSVIQRGIAAASSIFEFIDEKEEVNEGTESFTRARGEISIENLFFKYPGANRDCLSNINVTIHPGQTAAFVGASGSGKSSLVKLLLRFYDPNDGSIRIDGKDIRDITLKSLREQLSYVSQDLVLFNDSIANNIAYGAKRKVSKEEIYDAAVAANVIEFAECLPKGLDTSIGENGTFLSGGQRQRIAIARAIIKDAPIILLDEATSALDTESEKVIKLVLDNLPNNITKIVVAHRLSTIKNADKIFVVYSGGIVESGTHNELLAKKGHYARLIYSQEELEHAEL
ncbi:MAG: lipid A export permease/ATP-binding protein MsbA, partial [Francisellaceae bacterium]|nr:lipid A export permease/ATP-binding protein MsbA [Francisellaceae bacterium]